MHKIRFTIVLIYLVLLSIPVYSLRAPTIQKSGRWEALNSIYLVTAKIDDKAERVCLPRLIFKEKTDENQLEQKIREATSSQDAVFHLYHDGLGRPKKENGMFYASDVFLKDLNMTYTGYVRKLGYKFTLSKTPAYEDDDYLREIGTSDSLSGTVDKLISAKKKADEEEKEKEDPQKKLAFKSHLRVATVYDVLPKGVIPSPIRNQHSKVASIINNLKSRPYKTEIIQIDPLRWASGYMGSLNEKGEIDMARCEGQIVDMVIRVPNKSGWLTAEMLKELKNTPCEYVLSRYKNGLEVVEGARYLLHDIYFGKLKLSWEEWLAKHGLECPEFKEKPEYASGVVPIEIRTVNGILKSLDALSLCQINFTEKSNLVYPQEIMRVFPPKPRPEKKQILKFLRAYNQAYSGKSLTVHLMVCPDGKSYTELGQKRAKRIRYNDTSKFFADTQQEVIKEMNPNSKSN